MCRSSADRWGALSRDRAVRTAAFWTPAGPDVRSAVLRHAADHPHGEPVRDPGGEPGRHRGCADGVRGAEADEAQGGDQILHRRVEGPPGLLVQGAPAARRARPARRPRRGRPGDRLLQQAVRRQPAALDVEPGVPGIDAVGRERNPFIAVLRRIWDLIPYLGDVWVPFVFHFDFLDTATGQPVMSSERIWAVRDRYDVTVQDPRLDFRVAAAMAVALDALQSR